jgi:hypothetical protein
MMPIAPARRFVVGALAAGLFAGVSGTPVLAANECRVSVGFHEGADAARRERSLRFVISVGDVLPRAIARLSFVRNEGPHDVRLMFDRLPPLQLMRGQAEPKLGNFPTEVGLKSIECLPAITHSPFHGMHPDGCVHDDGPRVTEPCFHNHFFDRWRTA